MHPEWLTNTVAGTPAAELPVATGTPVAAVTDGTVTAAGDGQVVLAGTDGAVYTLAGVSAKVAAGTKVSSGDSLGTASGTVRFTIVVPDVAGPVCPQQALMAWSADDVIDVHALANQGCVTGQSVTPTASVLVVSDQPASAVAADLPAMLGLTGAAGAGQIASVTAVRGATLVAQVTAGMAAHPDLVVVAAGKPSHDDLAAVMAAAGPTQPVLWIDSHDPADPAAAATVSGRANLRIAEVGSIIGAAAGWTAGSAEAVTADVANYLSVAYGLPETPGAQAISYALEQLGKPYEWAGAGPATFDCSGLTMLALRQVGLGTVHNAAAQYAATDGNLVKSPAQLQPGNLVFFGPNPAGIHHVGIYLGGGQFIDAPDTGSVVRFDTLGPGWDYYGATDPFAGLLVTAVAAPAGSVRAQGRGMVDRMWGDAQWPYLDALWTRESGWNATADNPTSGAFGIPQALPADKMTSAGADWLTNPVTQIRWGLLYIATRYGTPQAAWAHEVAAGWY